jgi:hypothetical protein
MSEQKPVARYVARRLTTEGTEEFFGIMLVPALPPLTLFFTADQLKAERENTVMRCIEIAIMYIEMDSVCELMKSEMLEVISANESKENEVKDENNL